MKTLHVAFRVSDLRRSLAYYLALGYIELGQLAVDDETRIVFLKFPGEPVVSLELVSRPADGRVDVGSGFHHLVIQVDDLAVYLKTLVAAGLEPGPLQHPGGPDGPKTSWLGDPDGYPIELVEWPAGHADGLTEADVSGGSHQEQVD